MIDIYYEIERLLQYSMEKNILHSEDKIFARNSILGILKINDFQERTVPVEKLENPSIILEKILTFASENGLLQEDSVTFRDLLDTEIMSTLVPRPSEVIGKFKSDYKSSPEQATSEYYNLARYSNYIRMDRIDKNKHWYSKTEYGDLEITINLSKPEKDPKAIAASKNIKSSTYPRCLLCRENEGYFGNVNHPARENLRLIPVNLGGAKWFLQYSPYVYYNEHSIIFSEEHTPMKISRESMEKLLEFTEQFPHYFVGSNADLPIVGGSILSHDHFQGGNHEFPMAKAQVYEKFEFKGFTGVRGGIVNWPMSVIRINSKDRHELLNLAEKILDKWRGYSDETVEILAYSGEEPHNTITPIARRRDDLFELDLVLRNNRTTEENPLGIFHPHTEVHNIKKENIGLIEVMGLAILPGRLEYELKLLSEYILKEDYEYAIKSDEDSVKHLDFAKNIKIKYPELNESNVMEILEESVGDVFLTVLLHAGVYKRDLKGKDAFRKFMNEFK